MKIYQLVNKNTGYCESIVASEPKYENTFSFTIFEPTGIYLDGTIDTVKNISSGLIKQTGIADYYFTGEDEDKDGYYQFSNIEGHISFMRHMFFVYEIAAATIKDFSPRNFKDVFKVRELGILDNYSIVEFETNGKIDIHNIGKAINSFLRESTAKDYIYIPEPNEK